MQYALYSLLVLLSVTCSFEELVMRFEEPESRNRWDSPLISLLVSLITAFVFVNCLITLSTCAYCLR